MRVLAKSTRHVEPAGTLVPIEYSQAQRLRPFTAREAFRFSHQHARHAATPVLGSHVKVVDPRERSRIIRRLAACRRHDADKSDGLVAAVRHEDAPIVACALLIQVRQVISDDRLAVRPRRLDAAVKVLMVDDTVPQRLCVTSRVEAPDMYLSLQVSH